MTRRKRWGARLVHERALHGRALLALAPFLVAAFPATAREIHFDCARTGQTVKVDIDTERRFLQMMWSEGVAEEFLDGGSYVSGPGSFGEKEKVTYVVSFDKEVVTFGQNRVCIESGANPKCADRQTRNTLDMARGELKYDDGDEIAVLRCVPAPPGRGF
jgi:hypothetical protein